MPDQLATRIRKARVDAGMSREQLAIKLGVSFATIYRYETGKTKRIALAQVQAIAKHTKRPMSFFLNGRAAQR